MKPDPPLERWERWLLWILFGVGTAGIGPLYVALFVALWWVGDRAETWLRRAAGHPWTPLTASQRRRRATLAQTRQDAPGRGARCAAGVIPEPPPPPAPWRRRAFPKR